MMNKESAFPIALADGWAARGMTLRDYFAAAAMQGMLASNSDESNIAGVAYLIADDMMLVREEK